MGRLESMDDIMAEVVAAARRRWGEFAPQESDIIGKGRGDRISACRAVFCGLCWRRTEHSTPEITVRINRRHASTVTTASHRYEKSVRGHGATRCDALIVELCEVIEMEGSG